MKITMSAARPVTAGIERDEPTFKALVKAVKPWVAKQLTSEDETDLDYFYEGELKPDALAKVIKHLLKEGFKPTRKGYKNGKVRVELNPESIYFNIEGYGA